MIASGRAPPKRRRRAAVGLGLAVLIAASPAWAIFVESPTNQTKSGAPPRRLTPVIRGPVKVPSPQSSASPTPFRPRPLPPPRPKSTPMPGVTNMPLAAAAAILARQGLAASQVSPMASDAPPGWVVVQKPLPRTPVMAGAPIVLTVSNGPPRPAARRAGAVASEPLVLGSSRQRGAGGLVRPVQHRRVVRRQPGRSSRAAGDRLDSANRRLLVSRVAGGAGRGPGRRRGRSRLGVSATAAGDPLRAGAPSHAGNRDRIDERPAA
jgi:hypothetical protein